MSKLVVKNRYGNTPNDILNSKDLSLKAKGLFGYIQSKPDDWSFSVKKICSQMKESEDSIGSTVKELEAFGLLERHKSIDEKGRWQVDYILKEVINIAENISIPPFTPLDSTHTVKPPNNSNKELVKKNRINTSKTEVLPVFSNSKEIEEIIFSMEDIDPKNKKNYKNKTERQSCTDLIEYYGYNTVLKTIETYKDLKKENKPFLPTITSPYELLQKYTKLKPFLSKEEIMYNREQKLEILKNKLSPDKYKDLFLKIESREIIILSDYNKGDDDLLERSSLKLNLSKQELIEKITKGDNIFMKYGN